MARVFAYLMSDSDVDLSDEGIFSDTSKIIGEALKNVHQQGGEEQFVSKHAFEIALKKLV
jgi:hypothetical protein